ncbi:YopX family protein [Solibacillus silvestris]
MREIKFRAWDKEKGFMFIPTSIEISQGNNFQKWDGWKPMAWRDETPSEGSGGIGRFIGEECEIMQSTGLTDQANNEIYIGDIVSYSGPYTKYEVIINPITQIPVLDNEQGMENLHLVNKEVVVIGNVYEHPHLLTTT